MRSSQCLYTCSSAAPPLHDTRQQSITRRAASHMSVACFPCIMAELNLKWSSHIDLLTSLDQLFEEKSFVDVTIAVEGQLIKAHRVVLCASSPYFSEILKSNQVSHPIIFMRDVKFKEMKAILDFVYKGETCISQEHFHGVLKTAEALKITGLCNISWADPPVNNTQKFSPTSTKNAPASCHLQVHSLSEQGTSKSIYQFERDIPTEELHILKHEPPEAKVVSGLETSILIHTSPDSEDTIDIVEQMVAVDETKDSKIVEHDMEKIIQEGYIEPIKLSDIPSGSGTTVMLLENSSAVNVNTESSITSQDKPPGRQYTKADFQEALNMVRQGHMGIKPAARAYNIPVATLYHAARRNKISSPMQQGGYHMSFKSLRQNKIKSTSNTETAEGWSQFMK